jgi:hypothetical protein
VVALQDAVVDGALFTARALYAVTS